VQYRFDCGSGEGLVRVTDVSVSDGIWHDVRLERHGSIAEIVVDGVYRSHGAAPGVNDVINLDNNDVFFGAEVRLVPSIHQTFDDVRMGFVGCLDDIRLNDILLPQHITSPPVSINSLGGHISEINNSNQLATLKRFTNVEFICRVSSDRPGNILCHERSFQINSAFLVYVIKSTLILLELTHPKVQVKFDLVKTCFS